MWLSVLDSAVLDGWIWICNIFTLNMAYLDDTQLYLCRTWKIGLGVRCNSIEEEERKQKYLLKNIG